MPHTGRGPCPALPAVTVRPGRPGMPGPARVAAMPSLVSYNRGLHYSPRWGLLASAAGKGGCATAVGPGAALALAGPAGKVGSYLPRRLRPPAAGPGPRPGPLPADRGGSRFASRCVPVATVTSLAPPRCGTPTLELAAITTEMPAGTTLMVTAPGSAAMPPHLQVVMVNGPAYRAGLLAAPSTRQPGIVVLTDLTPTVLGWRGQPRPGWLAWLADHPRRPRRACSVRRGLIGQDTTDQVWNGTHTVFFWTYALVDVAAFAGVGLLFWGGQPERRRRRGALWRIAGTIAGAVPAGSFLANLVPWWLMPHPAVWQYGLTLGWTAVVSAIALAGPWRRDPFGPPGAVALMTVLIVGLDVMTGSRLQLGSPFGLSLLQAGRFYGIGGEAIGLYAVCGMIAVAWVGNTLLRPAARTPAPPSPARAPAGAGRLPPRPRSRSSW